MHGKTCAGTWVKGVKDGAPREVYLYHVVDNQWSMREYGSQAVVWQTAINPVVALELLAAGTWSGSGVLGPEAFPPRPFLDLLDEFDMILVMTVEPGFGGQPFIDGTLPKVRRARQAIRAANAATWIQVDGGVSRQTIGRIAAAGADTFVAGSAVYDADDIAAEIAALRALATPTVSA